MNSGHEEAERKGKESFLFPVSPTALFIVFLGELKGVKIGRVCVVLF